MAAYAALVSLMHIIDDLEKHHSPPVSLNKQQVQSLTENVMFLQEFLQGYNSPVVDGDEADPLEMRIADAAYAAEDVIESHIVDRIHHQEFLEGYNSPVANGDEADPLEMRIADAAYVAKDVIESHIVDKIKLSRSKEAIISRFINCFRGQRNPNNVSPSAAYAAEDAKIKLYQDVQNVSSSAGAQSDLRNGFDQESGDDETMMNDESSCITIQRINDETIKLYQDLQKVIEEMDLIKREAMEIDTEKVVIPDQGHRFVPIATLRPSSSSTRKNNSFVACSDDVVHGIMEKLVSDQRDCQVIPIVGMVGIGKTTLARTVYSKPLIKEHFDICAWATISQQYDTREVLLEILSQATNKKKEELSGRSEDELGLELHKYLFGRRFLIVMDDMWSIDAWDKIQRFFPNDNNGSRVLVTTRISQLCYQLNNEYSHQMEFLDEASSWVLFSKTVFGENNCPPELEETGKKIVENCRGLPLSIVVVGGILKKLDLTKECWESIRKNLTTVVNLENDKHCLRLLKLSYINLPVHLKPCFLYMGVFEEDQKIRVSTLVKLWVWEGFLKPIDGKSLEAIAKGFLKDLVDRNLILTDELGSTGNIKWVKVHDLLRDLCLSEVKKEGFYHVVGQRSPPCISRQRRVVIRRNTSEEEVADELQCMSMSHVRSLICANGKVPRRCRNLRLLRVFLAYNRYRDKRMNSLQQYVNLQHLSVKVRSISSIFASLNLFWNLHSLIVSCSDESTVPAEIWKMTQLRHIESSETRFCLPDPPNDAVIMENLQVLKGLRNFKFGEEVVRRIPNIKKLEIHYMFGREGMEYDDYYCLSNIKCLSKLESLCITYPFIISGIYPHKLTFPQSLKSLTLWLNSDYEWEEVLEKIGWLPNLEKLNLFKAHFGRGKWEVVEDQFPSLKYLELHFCRNLKEWRAAAEASSIFPRLEKLHLNGLEVLKEIPSQIGDIPTLQSVVLHKCSSSAVKSMKEIVDEQVECQGDQLPFHVKVRLLKKDEAVESLADPNFEVFVV